MTQPIHIEDRFSELFDGSLSDQEQASAREHLATCEACRSSYASFERATLALSSLRLADTPSAHVDDVMAALAPAFTTRPSGWIRARRILTHAAALLFGVGLAWAFGRSGGTPQGDTEVAPRVVEVVREVPKEILREVPVEVVRTVWIEHVAYLDRPISSSPSRDEQARHELVSKLASALSEVARAAVSFQTTRREGASTLRQSEAEPAPVPATKPMGSEGAPQLAVASPLLDERASGREAHANSRATHRPSNPSWGPSSRPRSLADPSSSEIASPVRILRTDGRVRIRTRGPLAEVVPVLIDTLDDADPNVARAAEQHLESLRAELVGEGALPLRARDSLQERASQSPSDRLLGLFAPAAASEEAPATPDPRASWTDWWLDHSPTLAAANVH